MTAVHAEGVCADRMETRTPAATSSVQVLCQPSLLVCMRKKSACGAYDLSCIDPVDACFDTGCR
jgi:hypothetical protein